MATSPKASNASTSRPGAPRVRRPVVTREQLFHRALAIVDAEGLAALTMRRLAADVGIEAASLYHHVRNKEALLDGALEVMRSQMSFDEPLPTDWRELMEVVFLRYLAVLTEHPHMLPLAGRHLPGEPAEGLVHLSRQGLSEDEAVALWQSILGFVVGFAMFASSALPEDTGHLPPGLAERMRTWDAATARRTLRAILAAYGPQRQPGGSGGVGGHPADVR